MDMYTDPVLELLHYTGPCSVEARFKWSLSLNRIHDGARGPLLPRAPRRLVRVYCDRTTYPGRRPELRVALLRGLEPRRERLDEARRVLGHEAALLVHRHELLVVEGVGATTGPAG